MSEESKGWRPDAGDKITGHVIDIATGDGGYGPYPIVVLQTEDGSEVAVHAFHQVLRTELARRRPKVGNELTITYLGKAPTKDGKSEYHTYRVVGGQVQGYDWNQDLPDDQRQPPSDDVPIETGDLPEPVPVPAGFKPAADDDDIPF